MTVRDDEAPVFDPHPLVELPPPPGRKAVVLPPARGVAPKSGALTPGTLLRTRAIAEALFTPDDLVPPPEDRLSWVMTEYADFMARSTRRGRFLFTAAAYAITWVSPRLARRPGPFTQAPLTARVEMLRAVEASPLASILIALRAILCILYYEHPEAAQDAGIWLGPETSP